MGAATKALVPPSLGVNGLILAPYTGLGACRGITQCCCFIPHWELGDQEIHEVPQPCLAPHWDLCRPFPTFRSELPEQSVWKCSLGSLSGLGTREDTSAPCQARSMPRCHLRAPALAQLTAAEELSHEHFNSALVKCRQVLFFRY